MADLLPTRAELIAQFHQKHGSPEAVGWAPRRRFRFGYSFPADVYEALVAKLVVPGTSWLDVGGGHQLFPENARLSRDVASRCSRLVAVDPSDTVQKNEFATERVRAFLEDYRTDESFDVATLRMVVEHVERPREIVAALGRLIKPGGLAVVFTVNLFSPITLVSRLVPFGLHHRLKRLFWGGAEEDTFPVHYRMNTRRELGRLFRTAGFEERAFARLDDLSLFGKFRWPGLAELLAWKCFRTFGVTYPENCLLGVYVRK